MKKTAMLLTLLLILPVHALTLTEFKAEIVHHKDYDKLTVSQWDKRIQYRGFDERSQKDFNYFEPMYVKKIAVLREHLADNWEFSARISANGKKLGEEALPDEWYYCVAKEKRLVDKLACVLKEQQLRKDKLVVRSDIHDAVNRYMCFTPTDSATLTGTWTFTNASNSVTSGVANGNALAEVDAGDYVRQSDGTAWYEVTAVPDDDTITIATNFQQATHTDAIGASKCADYDTMDGSTIAKAFVSMNQYTTTEARTAGDILYVRANETHGTNGVDITFDEDGTVDDYIKIIGCDATTNDPWSDSSDVKPIVDFEDKAYQVSVNGDLRWYFELLDFRQSNDTNGAVYVYASHHAYFKDCVFQDGNTSSVHGIYSKLSANVWLDGCSFLNTNGIAIFGNRTNIMIKDCTIDAGVAGATDGLYGETSNIWIYNTTIAGSNAFGTAAIRTNYGSIIHMRNVTFGTETYSIASALDRIYSEDNDGTFESHIGRFRHGTVERDTGTVRSGGADTSAKITPNVHCGQLLPMTISGYDTGQHDFAIWTQADTAITVTVYASVGSAWDAALTAAECYIKTSHLSNAGTAARTLTQSSEQIANDTTWTALTTTITPAREGFVYVTFFLAEYEDASEHVFVDIWAKAG